MTLIPKLHLLFRVACAMCFIGHGAFGIITKQIWCNYFGVFGIGEALSYQLMPVVGIADITCGILFIVYPVRAVAGWLIIWGLFTAALRPLSAEPFAEFLERAGNYGAPFILLLLSGPFPTTAKQWFEKMQPQPISERQMKIVFISLRVVACTLLLGHGWLNLIEKDGLLDQYASIGIANTMLTARVIGTIEVVAALLILVKPVRQIVFIVFVWKMLSEVLYPAYPVFEWVERGGSYAILLGLWMVMQPRSVPDIMIPTRALAFVSVLGLLIFTSCSNNPGTLSNQEVVRMLEKNNVYPKTIEYRLFINTESSAQQVEASDLDDQGLVTVQLTHTLDDIGGSLIHFTDKAAPYMLPKPDSLESIESQILKVGEEVIEEVNDIAYSQDGTTAEVAYKIRIENQTPFFVLVPNEMPVYRRTSFKKSSGGWEWSGKISESMTPVVF